jgi:TonB family protein
VDPCDRVAAALSRRIDATMTYPRWAEEMNVSGVVRLTLGVGRDGRPRGIRVTGTSGDTRLDRYAMDTARAVTGLPDGCSRPISIPVTFRINRSARR